MTSARRTVRSIAHRSSASAFCLEPVERRMLLAAAITAAVGDAIERASDRAQYAKYDLDVTRQWAVRAKPKANVVALAGDLGATSVRPSGVLDDVYIATFARTKLNRLGGLAIGRDIETAVGKRASWPLIARQQSTRSIPNDPRFANQWHLRNTGQSGGVVGADTNIVDVWDQYTGSGVVIGVVDDGVTPAHQDLAPNYLPALSYDFNRGDAIPDGGDHGTSVAGVAAARGGNGLGGSGAAPLASIAGLQLIDGAANDSQEANALSYLRNDIDIYTNSWGPDDAGTTLEAPGPLTLAAFQSSVLNGRNGLGNIYAWAAGNGGNADNSNFDGYANSRYAISVAAMTNTAARSSYSERGSNVLVSAYSNGGSLGIDTTAGTSNSAYTTSFGGTSSATPLVAGVIALMLEANPSLGWRDVQHILAKSAEKVSPTDSGWSDNAAGLHINDKFGFGGVDAAAAVALAKTWTNVSPETSATTGTLAVNAAITNNSAAGITRSATITDAIKVESVEVVFTATHATRGELQVILTSPSGTQSVLATERTDTGDNFSSWTFTTRRSLDEDARGTWTLTVIDDSGTAAGTWGSWKLNVFGSQAISEPTIAGIVYSDLDGAGSRDADESGVSSVTAWADLNVDGAFDSGEPSAVTGATGGYVITGIAPGSYTVRVITPAGQIVSDPATNERAVTLSAATPYAGSVNFGLVTPSAIGVAYDDLNANGQRDPTDPALAGVTVFADVDGDGTLDAGETSTTSNAAGEYRLTGLSVGATTVVRTLAPAGRRLTSVNALAGFGVTPIAGAYVAAGRDLGSTRTVRLAGRSFDDLNGNGVSDAGEVGIAGVRIFLDANDNGTWDSGSFDRVQETDLALPDDRLTRTSTLAIAGSNAIASNLSVRLAITHTYVSDLTATLISPAGTRVILMQGNGGSSDGVNVTFNTAATTTPSAWTTGTGVISGTYRPIGNLAAFNGVPIDGNWKLEIVDSDAGDAGTLTAWSIFGSFSESSVITDTSGAYAFDAVPAATYRVRQQAPASPYELASPAAAVQTVTLASGTVADDRDFANVNIARPTLVGGSYQFDATTPSVLLNFSTSVVVEPADLTLTNRTTGEVLAASTMSIATDGTTATITFPGFTNGALPDGEYRLIIGTGVADAAGNALATPATVEFFILAGDANRDRVVDFADLVIVAQNYGQTGKTFSQGNLDYSADGNVDFADLVLLAQRYNKTMAPPATAMAAPISAKAVAVKKRSATVSGFR